LPCVGFFTKNKPQLAVQYFGTDNGVKHGSPPVAIALAADGRKGRGGRVGALPLVDLSFPKQAKPKEGER